MPSQQTPASKIINLIGDEGAKLQPANYKDFVEEIHSHCEALLECIKDEEDEN